MLQRRCGVMDVVGGVGWSDAPVSFKNFVETLPLDVFHDEEMPSIVFVGVECLDNAGMRELSERPGFAPEAGNGVGITNAFGRQYLDAHAAVQARAICQEHRPHPALAEFAAELITAPLFNNHGPADRLVGWH